MKRQSCVLLAGLLGAFVCATPDAGARGKDIPLADVPANVAEVAKNAVDGIQLAEAAVFEGNMGQVYELDGTVDGREYEIHVTAEGTLIHAKLEKDHDDDGDKENDLDDEDEDDEDEDDEDEDDDEDDDNEEHKHKCDEHKGH